MSIVLSRRSLLRGLIAAPAVVVAERLMPVKLWKPERIGPIVQFIPEAGGEVRWYWSHGAIIGERNGLRSIVALVGNDGWIRRIA